MPRLLSKQYSALIRALPIEEQHTLVQAAPWRVWAANTPAAEWVDYLFAGHSQIEITRDWLHSSNNEPEARCLGILLWGYPAGNRGAGHLHWLKHFAELTAAARSAEANWDDYLAGLRGIGKVGISTASKLATFFGHRFGPFTAQILDGQIIAVLQEGRWSELKPLQGMTYQSAAEDYPHYLATLEGIAHAGGFKAEQLEFFLFSLGRMF